MANITGMDNPDTLIGTPEADLILALDGGDTVQGGLGDDSVDGGPGADLLYGDNATRGPLPSDLGPPGTPQPGDNLILGGEGNDTVYAGYGSDQVFGGEGDDLLTGSGSYLPLGNGPGGPLDFAGSTQPIDHLDGADLIEGALGNDVLNGGSGADTLLGGEGNDTLAGGFGPDVLTGGPGADDFNVRQIFQRATGGAGPEPDTFFGNGFGLEVGPGARDLVTDFEQGQDRIGIAQYVAVDRDVAGPNAAVFFGTGELQPVAAMPSFGGVPAIGIRYEIQGDRTLVQIFAPNRGDSTPRVDGEMELLGAYHLNATDFGPPGAVTDRSGDWDRLAADVQANFAATGQWFASGNPFSPPPQLVDWDALAAQVEEVFAVTGQWFVGGGLPPFLPSPRPAVDWDALAAEVQANFAATGQWFA
jgi:hypothetical protein